MRDCGEREHRGECSSRAHEPGREDSDAGQAEYPEHSQRSEKNEQHRHEQLLILTAHGSLVLNELAAGSSRSQMRSHFTRITSASSFKPATVVRDYHSDPVYDSKEII
jgi:hypothetical protein